jgi:hypothetical protein
LLEEVVMKYVKAAGRMRDDWAESSDEVKSRLWKDLHALEQDARDLLEQVRSVKSWGNGIDLAVEEIEDDKGNWTVRLLSDGEYVGTIDFGLTYEGAIQSLREYETFFKGKGLQVRLVTP